MSESPPHGIPAHASIETLQRAIDTGSLAHVQKLLGSLHPAEIALLIGSLPPSIRLVVWGLVPEERRGDVLAELPEDTRTALLGEVEAETLAGMLADLDPDDLADILQGLPNTVIQQVLATMDQQNRQRIEAVLHHPEDSAGGLMNTDVVTVRADVTLEVVLRYLRLRREIPSSTDSLMVVDRNDRFQGVLSLGTLLTSDPELTVAEVMDVEVEPITADTPAQKVASLFEQRDLVSAPVVDGFRRLLGRITVDDVVDVIREEADQSLRGLAGLAEDDDLFMTIPASATRRALWLGINLVTAFIAAWVIGRFEATIEKIVALAILMPIVASMGGIAGSQTLVLMVRGIALGRAGPANARWLLGRQVAVVFLNGLLWGTVVAAIAWFWFGDPRIGAVLGAALLVNLTCAAFAGVLIPLALRAMGIDPALAGSMMLTTITDVVGFAAFLGLATLFLL